MCDIFFSLSQYLPSNCTLVWLGAGSWSDRINRGSLGGLKILVVVFRWSRGWSWRCVWGVLGVVLGTSSFVFVLLTIRLAKQASEALKF